MLRELAVFIMQKLKLILRLRICNSWPLPKTQLAGFASGKVHLPFFAMEDS